MGWFATYKALQDGIGPYGDVAQSLKGEVDPPRTLSVALEKIDKAISAGIYSPDDTAEKRITYWKNKNGVVR